MCLFKPTKISLNLETKRCVFGILLFLSGIIKETRFPENDCSVSINVQLFSLDVGKRAAGYRKILVIVLREMLVDGGDDEIIEICKNLM